MYGYGSEQQQVVKFVNKCCLPTRRLGIQLKFVFVQAGLTQTRHIQQGELQVRRQAAGHHEGRDSGISPAMTRRVALSTDKE